MFVRTLRPIATAGIVLAALVIGIVWGMAPPSGGIASAQSSVTDVFVLDSDAVNLPSEVSFERAIQLAEIDTLFLPHDPAAPDIKALIVSEELVDNLDPSQPEYTALRGLVDRHHVLFAVDTSIGEVASVLDLPVLMTSDSISTSDAGVALYKRAYGGWRTTAIGTIGWTARDTEGPDAELVTRPGSPYLLLGASLMDILQREETVPGSSTPFLAESSDEARMLLDYLNEKAREIAAAEATNTGQDDCSGPPVNPGNYAPIQFKDITGFTEAGSYETSKTAVVELKDFELDEFRVLCCPSAAFNTQTVAFHIKTCPTANPWLTKVLEQHAKDLDADATGEQSPDGGDSGGTVDQLIAAQGGRNYWIAVQRTQTHGTRSNAANALKSICWYAPTITVGITVPPEIPYSLTWTRGRPDASSPIVCSDPAKQGDVNQKAWWKQIDIWMQMRPAAGRALGGWEPVGSGNPPPPGPSQQDLELGVQGLSSGGSGGVPIPGPVAKTKWVWERPSAGVRQEDHSDTAQLLANWWYIDQSDSGTIFHRDGYHICPPSAPGQPGNDEVNPHSSWAGVGSNTYTVGAIWSSLVADDELLCNRLPVFQYAAVPLDLQWHWKLLQRMQTDLIFCTASGCDFFNYVDFYRYCETSEEPLILKAKCCKACMAVSAQ